MEQQPALFGNGKGRSIRLRVIRSKFETLTIREDAPPYITNRGPVQSAQIVYEIFADLCKETREEFWALHLDARNRVVCANQVAVGILDGALVHPREVFKDALLSSAATIILVHSHPSSGDPSPSQGDREVTRKICEAGKVMGIPVLDHVIVGTDNRWFSFREQGLIDGK